MMPYGGDDRQLLSNFRGFNLRLTPRAETPAHMPSRPSWSCSTCGAEWPCPPARERLTAELSGTRLAVAMWGYLEEFARDQGAGPLAGAFDRFIRWTRR